jgi:hypothetical protein
MVTAGHRCGVAHEPFNAPFIAHAMAPDTSKMLIPASNHVLLLLNDTHH